MLFSNNQHAVISVNKCCVERGIQAITGGPHISTNGKDELHYAVSTLFVRLQHWPCSLSLLQAHTQSPTLGFTPLSLIQALVPRKLQLSGASIGGDCVLYTSEKLRAPNIYSLQPGIRVSVCISPPCHASRISSRLHFKPVAKCKLLLSPFSLGRAFSWSPSHHPYPPVWSFSIELASFRQRENPQVLSRSGWSGGGSCRLI